MKEEHANYKDGSVTINDHPFPEAYVTSIADIAYAHDQQLPETLTAEILNATDHKVIRGVLDEIYIV